MKNDSGNKTPNAVPKKRAKSDLCSRADCQPKNYSELVLTLGELLQKSRRYVAETINSTLVATYWNVGKYIVEYEQNGSDKAKYGTGLILQLSKDLKLRYGKGFSKSNLIYMRKFYLSFPKSQTLSHLLSWSHYLEILKADDELEISFYTKECENAHWSIRELRRQMKSMLFHRIALSSDKKGVLELADNGVEIAKPEDIIKDPVVLDFLEIKHPKQLTERGLEKAIIDNLAQFLLELGKGFAFVGRQYHMMIGARHFYADLVFYHCILKTYVIIDLKRGSVTHEDVGQMNLYLNYFKNEICVAGDTEPVGIILGAYKDQTTVEYALQGISNKLFVSKYQLYLPDKNLLKAKLKELLERANK